MRGVNKVILVGNLGKDPEVRYAASGTAITNITVATTDSWKDKSSGEQTEKTEWHRVVLFARLGEIAGEYLRKGSQVYIEGRLQTRKWEKDGIDRYTTEIVASEMQMLGGRSGAGDTAPMPPTNNYTQGNYQQNSGGGQKSPAANLSAPMEAAPDDFDDDIPF